MTNKLGSADANSNPENFFEKLETMLQKIMYPKEYKHGDFDGVKSLDTFDYHLYQDINLALLSKAEQEFYRTLQDQSLYNLSDIYAIFFDYKTQ